MTRRGENYGGRSRQERATDRRERILTSALHLFGTRAYDDVTVADVCADARVSKRYFYEHFTDRPDLVRALHREQNMWLLKGVAAAAPESPGSLDEMLRPSVRRLLEMLRANPERAQVIYINAPRMETRRRGVIREDAQFLAGLLRRVGGHPTDHLRSDRMLLALVSGLSEVIIDWLSRDMTEDPVVLADHLTDYCVAVLNSLT
ncbi:TetR family transcriptional regulator [Paractinoplanes durhamensis]|uniref:TetR family transcriptional regulator n=1 Tax=Paractinoplanes durhamensis TaxID=113563 RepID=A0ABQ3Z1Y6_9ACTN|nr:TetR family transcriptional regulator [Actinoplanes durhamensis]